MRLIQFGSQDKYYSFKKFINWKLRFTFRFVNSFYSEGLPIFIGCLW
jgi:hypothetical protein